MAKRVVIIGGVATGMKTAARLRRRDKDVEIIVLERGPQLSYGACGFPYFISGDVKNFSQFDHTPQGIPRDAAFFKAVKAYKKDPSKFLGRPKPPKYKKDRQTYIATLIRQDFKIYPSPERSRQRHASGARGSGGGRRSAGRYRYD